MTAANVVVPDVPAADPVVGDVEAAEEAGGEVVKLGLGSLKVRYFTKIER